MQIKPFISKMAARIVAFFLPLSFSVCAQAQVLDTEFGSAGMLIINHSVYDLPTGSALRDGRLLVGSSEYDWTQPRIDAFQIDGDQDFSFGSGGDITWGWFDFPSIETGSILYDNDAIYVGYTTHFDAFVATIRKYDNDGQEVSSFGTDAVKSEVITTYETISWYDTFAGIKKWGDDVVMAGATPDTTFMLRINADGTPDADFGVNGISRLRWADYFGEGNAYNIYSWITYGDKLYFDLEYYDWLTSENVKKILPINSDGTLDVDGVIDITALNTSAILTDGETIYLKKSSNLQKAIGTTFTVDPTFGDDGILHNTSGYGATYAFGPDGSIYQFGSIGTAPQMAYCGRFTATGQIDTNFGEEGILTVDALIEDDQVYVSNVVVTETELYLIGGSGVFGVFEGGYSDMFVTRYTDIGSSIVEESEMELLLYPNPTNDAVTVRSITKGPWTICDVQGRVLLSGQSVNRNLTVDVSSLPHGSYILNAGPSHGNFTKQ